METLNRLKGSLTAYRGHLTKAYNEMESLMMNPDAVNEVAKKKCALDNIFKRYEEASFKYSQCLQQSAEREQIAQEHTREIARKEKFERQYLERTAFMEGPPSSETFETRVPLGGPSFVTAMEPRAFARETDMP